MVTTERVESSVKPLSSVRTVRRQYCRVLGTSCTTAGYVNLMDMVREGDFYDPWGTAMDWRFAIAEVVYRCAGITLPEFGPSLMISCGDDGAAEIAAEEQGTIGMVAGMWSDGLCTRRDMERVYMILARYTTWCELAGRDY